VSDLLKLTAFGRRFYEQKDGWFEETLTCATGTGVNEEGLQQSLDEFLAGALSACVWVLWDNETDAILARFLFQIQKLGPMRPTEGSDVLHLVCLAMPNSEHGASELSLGKSGSS